MKKLLLLAILIFRHYRYGIYSTFALLAIIMYAGFMATLVPKQPKPKQVISQLADTPLPTPNAEITYDPTSGTLSVDEVLPTPEPTPEILDLPTSDTMNMYIEIDSPFPELVELPVETPITTTVMEISEPEMAEIIPTPFRPADKPINLDAIGHILPALTEPTPDPNPTPTPEPTPTPKSKAKVKATPKPTPKPKAKPTPKPTPKKPVKSIYSDDDDGVFKKQSIPVVTPAPTPDTDRRAIAIINHQAWQDRYQHMVNCKCHTEEELQQAREQISLWYAETQK